MDKPKKSGKEKASNKAGKEIDKSAKKAAKEKEKVVKEVASNMACQRKQSRAGNKEKTRSEGSTAKKQKKDNLDNTVYSDVCCVCLGNYKDDAGTDKQWLQCKCLR